jgi:hypothetical protein
MPVPKYRTARSYFPYWEEKTPTGEEYKTIINNIGAVTATADKFLFRTPVSMLIKAIWILDDTTLAAHADNYWSFQVVSYQSGDRSQSVNLIATAVTTSTAGLTANTPRSLGVDQNTNLNAGDVLELQITKVASATSLVDLFVQVDYVPSVAGGTTTSTSTTTTTTTTSSSTTTTSSSTTTTSSSTTTTSSSTTIT